ncbi:MAG TPA: protein kinase [Polyangiaceae bacterium]|nr:protein kinase [Polyangiaceae bacterium]
MTSGDLLPALGTTLAGKYRLTRKLGQGGMGAVYEATHLRLGQRVAIKVVLPEVAARPELAYRFEHEARAAARLRGPHSARVYDVDTSPEGLPYLVMEYLEGHSLRDELRKRGPLPVDEAVRFVREACEGVDEAHRAGIVHRDIKPANLFLSVEGERRLVKVVDFGIAKLSDAGPADYRTATSAPLGTYLYMSPEQVRSPRSVDARTDIWSLGVTLYQLVSGKLPFQGEGALGVVYAVSTQDPPPLRALRPELPAALVAVVERALCKEPAGRFQTVRELADALAPFDPARHPSFGARGAVAAAPVRHRRAQREHHDGGEEPRRAATARRGEGRFAVAGALARFGDRRALRGRQPHGGPSGGAPALRRGPRPARDLARRDAQRGRVGSKRGAARGLVGAARRLARTGAPLAFGPGPREGRAARARGGHFDRDDT